MERETFEYIDGYQSCCKYHFNGNVNIIFSAPHGGSLMLDNVPDRTNDAYIRLSNIHDNFCDEDHRKIIVTKDTRTDEFTENVANELNKIGNFKPFIIIGKWHRKKVDFNREILDGTLNHPEAISAYENYHMNLNNAINQVNNLFGKGLLIDIHGHSQGNYSMIGYMLSRDQLNQNDLSNPSFKTSIESLCEPNRNECIRGQTSFGSILERYGLGVVYPSLANPKPGSRVFFPGGYIIQNYSSKINSIQIELPFDIRAGNNKRMNAQNFAQAIIEYMKINDLLITK
ncbi:unnamed protein product [Rotaria sp. Silwood1]|nr:unnamed protein product [Rotaria sp. Silwood1]CAF0784756.1 unnamed protein product [Rotaria sp. Silwood1]CAF3322868.1 unnamed protein product [Rotaria sp. Silwood1]CAF3346154.1 unnamed protein product [Rotaria sp. Silwood1]CAF4954844.1 unnamed protein product [Rotaria sp. Silwood1]